MPRTHAAALAATELLGHRSGSLTNSAAAAAVLDTALFLQLEKCTDHFGAVGKVFGDSCGAVKPKDPIHKRFGAALNNLMNKPYVKCFAGFLNK